MTEAAHPGAGGVAAHFPLLVRLSWTRVRSLFRRPTLPFAVGTVLPVVVVATALWTLGRVGTPLATGAEGGVTLGLLISGPIAFLAYGVLFRGGDDPFLRRLGVDPWALFLERSIRLASASGAIVAALAIPLLSSGAELLRPLFVGFAAASVAVGAAALSLAAAAWATSNPDGASWASAGIRKFDPGLARAAPLVYAPLLPFLAGAAAGGAAAAAPGVPAGRAGLALVAGLLGVLGGARVFSRAAPRFMPRASEMAYSPPPEGEGEGFRVGRGLSGLLPRRSAAVWVRDAAVAGRRFGWASRITWPVGIASIAALARWGDAPSARVWVLAAVGIALVVQSAAVIGLGIMERNGPRWLDRSAGLRWFERFLGRWAWAWGLSLWLLVPVALAWHWWSGVGGAYAWPLAGALISALAAGASLLNSERR